MNGLEDKLHWRKILGLWHCFKKGHIAEKGKYRRVIACLCGEHELPKMFGGSCYRPPAALRCGLCDGLEMDRRGKEESLPENPNWTRIMDVDYAPARIMTYVPYAPSRRLISPPRRTEPGTVPRHPKRSRAVGGRRPADSG